MVRFRPKGSELIEVWRISQDPAVQDDNNYHNTQCWSPDGRYISFTHYAANGREYGTDAAAEIHLFDLAEQRDLLVERGLNPRWANRAPWLLYNRLRPEDGPRNGRGTQVVKLDLATWQRTVIGYGLGRPTSVSYDDRYLYGIFYPPNSHSGDWWQPYQDEPRAARLAIREGAELQMLPGGWGVGYNSLLVNPAHPVIVSRDHHFRNYFFATPGTRDIPFPARHFLDLGLAGENPSRPFPIMEGSHFSWSGDGAYFLPGNGPIRGRKWNEPLPSNIHFLANISFGDVGPCGSSGRWLCGSTGGGSGALRIADLRSGEGRVVMQPHSFLCFPGSQDNSGPYDINAKGSPDGTKIAFVSTYDLLSGPAAAILGSGDDRILVDSTEGFPESGRLVNPAGFGGEVLAYKKKTPTSFEGLTRGLYGTNAKAPFRTDQMLTSFDSLLLPPERRKGKLLPPRGIREVVKDMDSPLMWQRSANVYVAVVRLPDRPHLRASGDRVELIPGENHGETRGYRVLINGKTLGAGLIRPGASLDLREPGTYAAVAVEWSGLESRPSLPLEISRPAVLRVLADPPADFHWTSDRWLSPAGQPISEAQAKGAAEAVRETVHLHDGVIQRQDWRHGQLARQDDLNPEGKPIRRLTYEGGKPTRREYLDREGNLVSTELFDAEGFITQSIGPGAAQWFYERGVPVRYARGSASFVKQDDRWVTAKPGAIHPRGRRR